MPPGEATSRGNARVVSSRPSGRPRGGWSGIGEPPGTCSESISIAEAFEGCPARARADESRSRAGLAVTARAALRKQASTTYRPSAGERVTSRIVRSLRRRGGLSKVEGALGLVTPVALTRGRNDGSQRIGGRKRCSVRRRECQRFDGDSARGRKRRGGGSKKDDLGRGPACRIEALGAASTDVVTRSRALKGARHQRGESRAGSRRGERLEARESDGFRVLVNGSWLQKSMEAPFASESPRQPVR